MSAFELTVQGFILGLGYGYVVCLLTRGGRDE
jgi:hypothetical protein